MLYFDIFFLFKTFSLIYNNSFIFLILLILLTNIC